MRFQGITYMPRLVMYPADMAEGWKLLNLSGASADHPSPHYLVHHDDLDSPTLQSTRRMQADTEKVFPSCTKRLSQCHVAHNHSPLSLSIL